MLIITGPSQLTRINCGSVTKCEQRRRACRVVAGPIITPISDEGLPPAERERVVDDRNKELAPTTEGKEGRREVEKCHSLDRRPVVASLAGLPHCLYFLYHLL